MAGAFKEGTNFRKFLDRPICRWKVIFWKVTVKQRDHPVLNIENARGFWVEVRHCRGERRWVGSVGQDGRGLVS